MGEFYRKLVDCSSAEIWFKKAIEIDPSNYDVYLLLANAYKDGGEKELAIETCEKAIRFKPQDDRAYTMLGLLYLKMQEFLRAEDLFKKALIISPEDETTIGALSVLYEETGRSQLAGEYSKKVNRLRLGYCLPITIKNYHKLKEMTDKRGIQLVCMQYPMRSVEPLKKMFENDQGRIIFVDNDGVFKKAVKKAGYQEYFVDMFGGDFGHCTDEGNKLLAQNIANTILKKVFGK
jgi:tetratricopeptide (TPR) repeat protein